MSEAARSAPIATLKTRNARSDRSARWSAALGHLLLVVPGGTVSENGRLCRGGGVEEQSDGGIGSFILPILQTLSTIISFRSPQLSPAQPRNFTVLHLPITRGFWRTLGQLRTAGEEER